MLRCFSILLMMASSAQIAHAETLSDLRSTVEGREVAISGLIGTGLDIMDDEALFFRDADGNQYPVVFDAGRDARRQLEGCKFALFGGGTPCVLEGQAEIELEGSRLRLIVFTAEISPPGAL